MSQCKWIISCLLIALFFNIPSLQGQTMARGETDIKIDAEKRAAVVKDIGELLIEKYIFLDVAERIKEHLDAKLKNGDYDTLDDPVRFTMVLVEDLYEISRDKHFHIEFNPQLADLVRAQESESEEEKGRAFQVSRERDRSTNFGFKKVENLTGNIGYLDLRYLSNAEYAGQTAVAAMNFLANADAIIIDIRDTPGGFPNMVQMLCSYFVKGTREGRTHLNTFERRFDNSSEQFWTQAYVPGPRMYDTDLYIVTSQYTGSGAEGLAYHLKNLQRVTLVGETTAGAAHPVKAVVIQDHFVMNLPEGRPINPISGTNWEGTGVEPHVAVRADQAFDTAYLMALQKLLKGVEDEDRLYQLNWAIDGLRAKLEPVQIDEATLDRYTGIYGERRIWLKDGQLFYQRTGPAFRLIPMKENYFALEGLDRFRVEFVLDESGQATELAGHYDNGMQDRSERTE